MGLVLCSAPEEVASEWDGEDEDTEERWPAS
jgi:hypothetical protein